MTNTGLQKLSEFYKPSEYSCQGQNEASERWIRAGTILHVVEGVVHVVSIVGDFVGASAE